MHLSQLFTQEEIINFLQKKGYTVFKGFQESERHIHGSTFIPCTKIIWTALRDGEKNEMYTTFEKEIKRKILE